MSSSVPGSTRRDDPWVRSFLGEEWVVTIRFYVGVLLAVLGVLLAAGGVLLGWEVRVVSGVAVSFLHVGAVVSVVGVVALWGCRLSKRQRQYLTRAEREREEIRSYLSFLDDLEAKHGSGEIAIPWSGDDREESNEGEEPDAGGERSDGGAGPFRELRSRLRLALEDLDEARRAVYRENYATFFSLYYDASRQEILLYDLLDEYAGGWAFGLGADGAAADEPDREAPTDPEPHRRRHLSQRIRSFAEGTLPEDQLALVRTYLGEPGTLPTPWQLYYAVRILHEWNVSQYESALGIKRFLRRFTVALVLVLVGLAAALVLAFPGEGFLRAANATSSEATRLPKNSVVLRDSFLVLVVLTGALGAVVSVIRDFDWEGFTTTTDPTVTEPAQMAEWFLSRIVFGSVSALFLFVLARSELGAVVLAENLLESPLALLLIVFVAGFSENLILQLLSDIVGWLSPRESSATTPAGSANRAGSSDGDGSSSRAGSSDGDGPSSRADEGSGTPEPETTPGEDDRRDDPPGSS